MPRSLLFGAVVALLLTGCGGSGGPMEVTGTVTLDKQPLAEGDIIFVPEDPKLGREGGKIKNGTFTMKAQPGKNKVEITAYREVPGKKGPMGNEPLLEAIIPARYNEKSTLTAEVSSEKRKFDFPLDGK